MMNDSEMTDSPDSAEIERRLERERPVPRAAFRGELRRRLSADDRGPSPSRLRIWIGAYALSGVLLLSVAAAGVAGAGPLAP